MAINAETRTAADDQKFDIQLLGAGTTFDMTFELALGDPPKGKDLGAYHQQLLDGLAMALNGFASGEITLGARKRRGYGQCKIEKWSVTHFDLTKPADLLAWLAYDRKDWKAASVQSKQSDKIADALGISLPDKDIRKTVTLDATFGLDSTLLIRSGFGDADSGPDTVHLHSPRKGGRVPVIPGTSWAGVLRHRALKIARTIWGKDNPKCKELVEGMFGPSEVEEKHARASRVSIAESEVTKSTSLVQTRVKIDRFTGGAYESALFTEQPLVGNPDSEVKLKLSMRVPHNKEADPREVGLLLLLLKDLWTGDLPIGGESGIGRGRLKGKEASFSIGPESTDRWKFIENPDGALTIDGKTDRLEEFVKAFNKGA